MIRISGKWEEVERGKGEERKGGGSGKGEEIGNRKWEGGGKGRGRK